MLDLCLLRPSPTCVLHLIYCAGYGVKSITTQILRLRFTREPSKRTLPKPSRPPCHTTLPQADTHKTITSSAPHEHQIQARSKITISRSQASKSSVKVRAFPPRDISSLGAMRLEPGPIQKSYVFHRRACVVCCFVACLMDFTKSLRERTLIYIYIYITV